VNDAAVQTLIQNFCHINCRSDSGASPRIQKRCPSRLISGNTKRLVSVARISVTAPTFRHAMKLRHISCS